MLSREQLPFPWVGFAIYAAGCLARLVRSVYVVGCFIDARMKIERENCTDPRGTSQELAPLLLLFIFYFMCWGAGSCICGVAPECRGIQVFLLVFRWSLRK